MPRIKKRPYEYFSVAADVMVVRTTARLEVLLVRRKFPPHQGAWALPGGFVERDEDAVTGARRELQEEVALRCRKLTEFGTFSAVHRDPRGRTLTVAYYALLQDCRGEAVAGDDAGQIQWFSVRKLPRLAFDHEEMIELGLKHYRHDLKCDRLKI